ncbi:hypothetical protein QWY86_14920 [Pedobacter aquatilis]|uniref:hypothetical protein n=1 Tax=Pedobacter aquatilis TaxID=351343 RepID=UPI0025B2EBB9|nr:hypothetical protein [Pedobacter aquatilis]MDN3587972.1 hypothetical protein [Pedobacter aquatilis]
MKFFRPYRCFKAFIIIAVLTTICFFAFVSQDKNVFAPNFLLSALADLYSFFQFPTHTFLWKIFSVNSALYFFGLVFNCALYAFIIEVGLALEMQKRYGKQENEKKEGED